MILITYREEYIEFSPNIQGEVSLRRASRFKVNFKVNFCFQNILSCFSDFAKELLTEIFETLTYTLKNYNTVSLTYFAQISDLA